MPPAEDPFEAFRKKKLLQEKAKKMEERRKGGGEATPGRAHEGGAVAEEPLERFLAKGKDPNLVSHRYVRRAGILPAERPGGFEPTRAQEGAASGVAATGSTENPADAASPRREDPSSDRVERFSRSPAPVDPDRAPIEGFDSGRFGRRPGVPEGVQSPAGLDRGRWSRNSAKGDES